MTAPLIIGEIMQNTYPNYYKKFSCIADKCPDTCCAGWEIVIDPESLSKYEALGGEYAEKIRSLITVDGDGDSIFSPENNRCPFLLDSGLCEMYIELGHNSLCRTCRLFPRHVTYFGARTETGLSLSCPEAARIIMESPEPIYFETEETHADIMPTAIDPSLYFTLIETRKTAINILQNRKFPIEKRIISFLALSEEIQHLIRKNRLSETKTICTKDFLAGQYEIGPHSDKKRVLAKYFGDFKSLEMLDESWKTRLDKAEKTLTVKFPDCEWEYEHLMIYFVFRYMTAAVFDGDLLAKAKFAAVSYIIISRLQAENIADKSARISAMQKYSKEVEHSQLNMDKIFSLIKKSRFYSTDNLINILSQKEN
ncbi:MAG: flagellin lysine-N-methylase [Clostridia bacterium]|nr:flagellin lysine-N-methylase [Clostridia bacterium]